MSGNVAAMNIRILPRFGTDPPSEAGKAATNHLTPQPARGERLSMRLAEPKAKLLTTVCGEDTTRGWVGSNLYRLDSYDQKFNVILNKIHNISIYKTKNWYLKNTKIINISFYVSSVTKLTCNFTNDNSDFFIYILPLRRRS